MNAINWFEIPVTQFEPAVQFYQQILGLSLKVDDSFPGCRMAIFAADCEQHEVAGCLTEHPDCRPNADGVRIYLNGGQDLQPILDRVAAAGGKVVMPKTFLRDDIGYIGMFSDLDGNVIGLHSLN